MGAFKVTLDHYFFNFFVTMETRSFMKQSRSSLGAVGTSSDVSASFGPLSNLFNFLETGKKREWHMQNIIL